MTIRLAPLVALFMGVVLELAGAAPSSTNNSPTTADFQCIRSEVETLRGKKFRREVPVAELSERTLRQICDRELEKEYPGQKLAYYEDLFAWLDIIPPGTNLKEVYANLMVDQVAGLYDSDAKKMYIPSFTTGITNPVKANEKKIEKFSPSLNNIVLAHEFTHALEDQYWPVDDPKDLDEKASTDRGTAHSFLLEGSATRAMIEVIPAQSTQGRSRRYFLLWNLLHSGLGEFVLKYALVDAWKGSDALVEGVPETLSRMEAMPYSFGYEFCTEIMHQWGLDGLDYIYEHPPTSSEQVMHSKKCWEWRDFPVQVGLSENLPGGWRQVSHDCAGEAGVAILLGCQLKNLNRGLQLASGWDGDCAGLFEGPDGKRLLIWASAWDTTEAAARCANAFLKERQVSHKAVVTTTHTTIAGQDERMQWQRPDGRRGVILRRGKHIILLETDNPASLEQAEAIAAAINFAEPPEDAARAAVNAPFLRFNPLLSWQRDGDYTITRSLAGLLSRHDRNSIGAADCVLLGLVAESRRTASFNQWELGAGLIGRHQSEARRGTDKTTLLPWGLLASHASIRLPQSPDKTISRTSLLWGLGAAMTFDGSKGRVCDLLPFGLLFHSASAPGQTSVHLLGTGLSRKKATDDSAGSGSTRLRLLGIPIWTSGKK